MAICHLDCGAPFTFCLSHTVCSSKRRQPIYFHPTFYTGSTMAFDIGVRFGLNALDWTMNCCERQIDVFAKRQMRVIAQNISSPGMTPEGAVGRCDRLPPAAATAAGRLVYVLPT